MVENNHQLTGIKLKLVPHNSAPRGFHRGSNWPCHPNSPCVGPLAEMKHTFHIPCPQASPWRKEDLDDLWVFFILNYLDSIS